MANDDYAYFCKRAETELQKAQQATNPQAVAAHYELAQAYIAKVTHGPSHGRAS